MGTVGAVAEPVAAASLGVPERAASPGRGGRLPRPARRRQLLAAAQEVFVERGYHATAMDEIADRAGVSKPVLYQHFPGKLELYLALLDTHAGSLVATVRAALGATTDNRVRVHGSIAAYFDFVDSEDGAYRLVFESDLRSEPAVRDRVEGQLRQCVEAIAATIAHDTGLPVAEAELLSVGLAGLAEVGARWWLTSQTDVSKERAVELLGGLMWRGLSRGPRTG